MDKVVINFLKQYGIEELKPFADKDGIYVYKKEGKINFCDSELNTVTKKDLELSDGILFIVQQEDRYKLASKDGEYEHIIEIGSELDYQAINNNCLIVNSQTAFRNTTVNYVKCENNGFVVINNPIETLVSDNWKKSHIVLNGVRYNNTRYLFSMDNHHLIANVDKDDNITSYILLDNSGKICFHTKEPNSCKIKYSEFEKTGSFHIIGQNKDEIHFYSTECLYPSLKKYKREYFINLNKSYAFAEGSHDDFLLSNVPIFKQTTGYNVNQQNFFWLIGVYSHTSNEPKGEHNAFYIDYDIRQNVIFSELGKPKFLGYNHGNLKYLVIRFKQFPNDEYVNKYESHDYVLYRSNGARIGTSFEGRYFITTERSDSGERYDNNTWYGLYDSKIQEHLLPTNYSFIDYGVDGDNLFVIVSIRNKRQRLFGVFLNNKIIIPINEYYEISKHYSGKFFYIQKEENNPKTDLYNSNGEFIISYNYAVAPYRFCDSWQEETSSDSVFKVYDTKETDAFKIIVKNKLISNETFDSIHWVTYDWQTDDRDILQCCSTKGYVGLYDIESEKWLVEVLKYKDLQYLRWNRLVIADKRILLDSSFNEVYNGESLTIVNHSAVSVLFDEQANKYLFYDVKEGKLINDMIFDGTTFVHEKFKYDLKSKELERFE